MEMERELGRLQYVVGLDTFSSNRATAPEIYLKVPCFSVGSMNLFIICLYGCSILLLYGALVLP